jgi:hypothetical protein
MNTMPLPRHLLPLLLALATLLLCSAGTAKGKPGPAAKPGLPKVTTAGKSPVQLLAEAKADIALFKTGTADQLLQAVVLHPDASTAQVEEALVVQCIMYYGDVMGAMTLIPAMARVGKEGSPLKAEIGKQLVLARRAFAASLSSYLNDTAGGAKLQQVSLTLPPFEDADAKRIHHTLTDQPTLDLIVSGFTKDPAPGLGLVSKSNLMGLYISSTAVAPKTKGFTPLRSKLSGGVAFEADQYLDWAAQACVEMAKMLKDPRGPDMRALSKRCDERILAWYGSSADNPHVKAAKKRRGK